MTADEELRDRLAAILLLEDLPPIDSPKHARAAVDALLPVVRRHAEQRAAEELRAAAMSANAMHPDEGWCVPTYVLNDRAAALAPEGETTP